MEERKLELTITQELYQKLRRLAEEAGNEELVEVATVGLAQWIEWRMAELDSRDPAQKYFINEALDELLQGKK